MSDLSGLSEKRRPSVMPCDPRLCFMAYRSVSVWEKARRPKEPCISACAVSVCLFGLRIVSATKAIKRAEECVHGC